MTQLLWSRIVAGAIVLGVIFYVSLDALAWRFGLPAGGSTESTTVGTWMDHSVWLCIALGALFCHLAASGPSPLNWRHVLGAIIGGAIAYAVTRLS